MNKGLGLYLYYFKLGIFELKLIQCLIRYTLLQQEKIECEKKLIVSGKPSDVTPGRELGKIPCEKDVDNTDGESYHVVKKSGDVEKETPANYSKTEDESLAKNAITEQKSQQERNKKIQLEK